LAIDAGIQFNSVALAELFFKLNKSFVLPKDGIPIEIVFRTKNSFSPDKKKLTVLLSVKLFEKSKNRPFEMEVSVEGIFSGKDYKELLKFSKILAPAHLFPFIREIIGNTTMKANMPPLLLPPVNLLAVRSKKKKS
jgi:preprotein translocase subunit SecB